MEKFLIYNKMLTIFHMQYKWVIFEPLTGECLGVWYIQVSEDVQVFEEISGKNLQVVVGQRPDMKKIQTRETKHDLFILPFFIPIYKV